MMEASHSRWLTQDDFERDLIDAVSASPFSARIMRPRGFSRITTRRSDLGEDAILDGITSLGEALESDLDASRTSGLNLRAALETLWRDDPADFVLRLAPSCLTHEPLMLDRISRDHSTSHAGMHARRLLELHRRRSGPLDTSESSPTSQSVQTPPQPQPHPPNPTNPSTATPSPIGEMSAPQAVSGVRAKNRRYRRLQSFLAEGTYFSFDAIMERAPDLYRDIVGGGAARDDSGEKPSRSQEPDLSSAPTQRRVGDPRSAATEDTDEEEEVDGDDQQPDSGDGGDGSDSSEEESLRLDSMSANVGAGVGDGGGGWAGGGKGGMLQLGDALREANEALRDHPRAAGALPMPSPHLQASLATRLLGLPAPTAPFPASASAANADVESGPSFGHSGVLPPSPPGGRVEEIRGGGAALTDDDDDDVGERGRGGGDKSSQMREELLEAAIGRFMAGLDFEWVDYATIDSDPALDDEKEAALDAGDESDDDDDKEVGVGG